MTVRWGERAVVAAVLYEKLREMKVKFLLHFGHLAAYFLHYSNKGQGRMIATGSSLPGRQLPCTAFQDQKQSQ